MRTVLAALLIGVTVSLVANMATTVYLHRALAHRALTLRPPAAQAFRFVVWVTTGIRPRQWVAVHRKHHAFTDVEGDPHSPVLNGWVKVQLMNVAMYRREARNPRTIERYARDLPPTGSTGCSTTTPWSASASASPPCARSPGGRSACWPPSSTSTSTSPAPRR